MLNLLEKASFALLLAIIVSAVTPRALGDGTGAHDDLFKIKGILKRYQQASAVKVELKKSVKLALLDEEKNSDGELLLSKGRMRLEITKPDPSTVIVNKNLIWIISPTTEELGGKTQVMK